MFGEGEAKPRTGLEDASKPLMLDSGSEKGAGRTGQAIADPNAAPVNTLPLSNLGMLVVYTTINLLTYFDRGALSGVLEALGKDLGGISSFQEGFLGSAFMGGYMVASPIFAHFVTKFEPLRNMALGLFIWCLATAGCGFSPVYELTALARIMTGFGEASFLCIAPPFIDKFAPPGRKSLWLSIFYATIPVGYALGFLVSGSFVENKPFGEKWSWRMLFIGEAVLMFPFVLFSLRGKSPFSFKTAEDEGEAESEDAAVDGTLDVLQSSHSSGRLAAAASSSSSAAAASAGGKSIAMVTVTPSSAAPSAAVAVVGISRGPAVSLGSSDAGSSVAGSIAASSAFPLPSSLHHRHSHSHHHHPDAAPPLLYPHDFVHGDGYGHSREDYNADASGEAHHRAHHHHHGSHRPSESAAHKSVASGSAALARVGPGAGAGDVDGVGADGMPPVVRTVSASTGPKREKRTGLQQLLHNLRILLTNRVYILSVLGYSAQTFVTGGFAFFGLKYSTQELKMGETTAGLSFGAVTVVTGIFGTLTGGLLLDHLRRKAGIPTALNKGPSKRSGSGSGADGRSLLDSEEGRLEADAGGGSPADADSADGEEDECPADKEKRMNDLKNHDNIRDRVESLHVALRFVTILNIIAFPLALLTFTLPSLPAFFLGLTATEFFLFCCFSPLNNAILWAVPFQLSPQAMAVSVVFTHLLGDALSPLLMGAMYDATKKWRLVMAICTGSLVLAVAYWSICWHHLNKLVALVATQPYSTAPPVAQSPSEAFAAITPISAPGPAVEGLSAPYSYVRRVLNWHMLDADTASGEAGDVAAASKIVGDDSSVGGAYAGLGAGSGARYSAVGAAPHGEEDGGGLLFDSKHLVARGEGDRI